MVIVTMPPKTTATRHIFLRRDSRSADEYGVNSSNVSGTAIQENSLESEEMFLNRPFLYGMEQGGHFVFLGICENPLRS